MRDQAVDLRAAVGTIRRRRKAVILLVGVGLVGGLYAGSRPATVAARSAVLLPTSGLDTGGIKTRDIKTEVQVAKSTAILDGAKRVVTPNLDATVLRRRTSVTEVTSDIFEVVVRAKSGHDAVLLADAIAGGYVAYATNTVNDEQGSVVATLQGQATDLERRIQTLNAQIVSESSRLTGLDPTSPTATRQVSLIDSLRSDEADLASGLAGVNNRIADARLNAAITNQGTRVLEPGKVVPAPSMAVRLTIDGGLGAIAGLVAGSLVALSRGRRDRRLHRRDDIANAMGVPVVASLTAKPPGNSEDWADLLTCYEPSVVDRWALRQALHGLGSPGEKGKANILVLALPGDRGGLLVGPQLAVFAASIGIQTALVVSTLNGSAVQLRAACRPIRPGLARARPKLRVYDASMVDDQPALEKAELTVSVVVLESNCLLPTWGRPTLTLLGLSAGFGTAESIAEAGILAMDAGQPIRGIVVENPDADDDTTGRLGQPERPASPDLPRRITGVTRDPAMTDRGSW